MVEKEVHTTKIKKGTRRTAVKKTGVKNVATKKTTKKSTIRKSSATPLKKTTRKAPTSIAQVHLQERKTNIILWSSVGILCVVLIGSIMTGVYSTGKINIENRTTVIRESATPEEKAVIDSIPVQTTSLPDGGLVPSGVPVEVPDTTPVSTTTDALASTTVNTLASTSPATISEVVDSETSTSTGTTTEVVAQ